jgi:deoxyribodipyrimidine photo-lyase
MKRGAGQRGATIVWLRQDLRLHDNLALIAAARRGGPVIPVYIWSPAEEGDWPPGAASKWWLHQSLRELDASLRKRGSRLIIARGAALEVLHRLASRAKADAVHFNERYEPYAITVSKAVRGGLEQGGVEVRGFNSSLLVEPDALLNLSGAPYRVYSAYRRRMLRDVPMQRPQKPPARLRAPLQWPPSLQLNALKLMPRIRWYSQMEQHWQPGEAGALRALRRFIKHGLRDYRIARELPAERGTSRLSPHLHFGEIGPRQIRHALGAKGHGSPFLSELIWREFAYHLLFHFPGTPSQPLRPEFARFPWRRNTKALRAWQHGHTGIPLVDAGMRELWAIGWMHNRVRMVVASMLVKNLLIPWQDGARWFWDTLLDADLANNTLNWQWVSGSGADAAPYFRIFNPVTQARRFDPDAKYVGRWVRGPQRPPIVDLAASREAALEAYQMMRRGATSK